MNIFFRIPRQQPNLMHPFIHLLELEDRTNGELLDVLRNPPTHTADGFVAALAVFPIDEWEEFVRDNVVAILRNRHLNEHEQAVIASVLNVQEW